MDALQAIRVFIKELISDFNSHPFQIDYQMPHLALAGIHFDIGSLNEAITSFYSSLPLLRYSEVLSTKQQWSSFKTIPIGSRNDDWPSSLKTHYLTYATAHKAELDYLLHSGELSGINITVGFQISDLSVKMRSGK